MSDGESFKPVKITVEVSAFTYGRLRAALRFLLDNSACREEDVRGLSELTETALIKETLRLERAYNEGQPFPADTRPIRRGPQGRGAQERAEWVRRGWHDSPPGS